MTMTATTISQAQKKLPQLVESVNFDNTPIIIVNENDNSKNAVLISEEDWNSLQETMCLYSIPGLVDSILEANRNINEKEKIKEEK